ncbi:site-specific DNA-methyltransferase [Microbacterium sp. NPDC089180]|uniref:site-specific DNA-methyltransferase n=1 Tax=unclassified Microbacterium TaxID=2609290 RepID=UPI00342E9361
MSHAARRGTSQNVVTSATAARDGSSCTSEVDAKMDWVCPLGAAESEVHVVGRLSLTWSNKDQALVSDDKGGYEWVDPADVRAAEVRILDEVERVGDVAGTAADNLLIHGDSRDALRSLIKTPEYAEQYKGKVKLVYIDPPFNTKQAFEHYDDNLEHSVWLSMMRERLDLIDQLLAPDGSVWVHLDDAEMAYAKVLLDEIFGRRSFIATIVWQKRYSRENRVAIGAVQDYILVYARKGSDWREVRNRIQRSGAKEYRNPNNDPRGPWRPIPLDVQGGHATASQFYDVMTPSGRVVRPANGRAWSVNAGVMQQLRDDGRLYFGLNGDGMPNTIRYLDEDQGLVPWTWWPHEEVGHTDESKKEIVGLFGDSSVFDTPKPERLMSRIIEIATKPGEIVVDAFAGSGTTAAVAHKLGRRWVTIERDADVLAKFTRPRLQKVVSGEDQGGILSTVTLVADKALPKGVTPEEAKQFSSLLSKFAKHLDDPLSALDEDDTEDISAELDLGLDEEPTDKFTDPDITKTVKRLKSLSKTSVAAASEWRGGGGFRELTVHQQAFKSFQLADFETVVVSDETDDATLGRAIAARLGYVLEASDGPFVGRKHRSRLAVIRGAVDEADIEGLLAGINSNETLLVAALAVIPEARQLLRRHSPGSRVLQVPQGLFPRSGVIK